MARVIGVATIRVEANTSGIKGDLAGLESSLGTLATNMRSKFALIGGAVAAVGIGRLAGDILSFGRDVTVELDRAEAMFRGLTSGAGEAESLLRRMTEYAINTPFELPTLSNTAAQLLAVGDGFGVTTGNLESFLDILGNVTAATGGSDEQMQRLVRVLGQMSSSGKILGQDMNQLAQNLPGFDVWQTLADGTGKSVEQLRALQDAGKLDELLTGNEAVAILLEGMKGVPGAAGAMERRMNTLEGATSKFKESIGLALAEGLSPFFKVLRDVMGDPAIMGALQELIGVFAELASGIVEQLAPHMPLLIEAFTGVLEAVTPLLPLVGLLAQMFGLLVTAITPILEPLTQFIGWVTEMVSKLDPAVLQAIAVGLAAIWIVGLGPLGVLVAAITAAVAVVVFLLGKMGVTWEDIVKGISAAWQWLVDNIFAPIGDLVMGIVGWFQDLYDTLVGHSIIPDLVEAIIEWFNKLIAPIKAVFEAIWTVAETIWGGIVETVTFYVSAIKFAVETYMAAIKLVVTTAFEGIKVVAQLVWSAIKLAIIEPIQSARDLAGAAIQAIRDKIDAAWGGLAGVVSGIWNGVKSAITGPMQAAWQFVSDKVNAIKNLVQSAIDKVKSIPGSGFIGNLAKGDLPGLAAGGIVTQPMLAVLGEQSKREAVIPLTNPGRAMQLMQQSGLDRLAAQMGGGGYGNGPLVTMPGAVIQDATDADLVAQRTMVALQAAMAA
jgi:tape measure domain-containing protein